MTLLRLFASAILAAVWGAGCANEDSRGDRIEGTVADDCTDGADNDGDGAFDCDDSGCQGASACDGDVSERGDTDATGSDAVDDADPDTPDADGGDTLADTEVLDTADAGEDGDDAGVGPDEDPGVEDADALDPDAADGDDATDAVAVGDADADGDADVEPPPTCDVVRELPPIPERCAGVDGVHDGHIAIASTADLVHLDGISEITGSLSVEATDLVDLDAFDCLTRVGDDLIVFDNAAVADASGFRSLEEVGGAFIFSENDAVTVFDAAPRLTRVEGALVMVRNPALERVAGFHNLTGVEGNITIRDHPVLETIYGLGALRIVGGDLAITANPMLCMSTVTCVLDRIVVPATPPVTWSTAANDDGC